MRPRTMALDDSERIAARWRAVLRHKFGADLRGVAFGMAISD